MSDEVKIPLPRSLQEIVGALLFASETPLTATEIRDAVRSVDAEEGENAEIVGVYKTCTSKEIAEALRGVEKALEVGGCGFKLVCADGSYRLQSAPSCGRYVRALLKMDRPSRLGRASLETLAIIAYRQPLTKSEIEAIRGVDVSANMKTLMDLQLIRLVGKSELPGHPFLYGTTPLFLEHFGLASLQQLNEIDPTLQRSNPRLKAESYKKKEVEKPTSEAEEQGGRGVPEEGDISEENEGPVDAVAHRVPDEGDISDENEESVDAVAHRVPDEGDISDENEEPVDAVAHRVPDEGDISDENEEPVDAVAHRVPNDDDDFFIDDTPDEFDDEDDEEDDESDGEEEESEDED